MASPYSNLDSKLERAIVAYLISKGCGSAEDILPFTTVEGRKYPNTTVVAWPSTVEFQNSGIYRIPVQISIKGSASEEPDAMNKANPRIQFDARVATTGDALVQKYADPADGHTMTLQATADDITSIGNALAVDASNGADPDQVQFAANNADMADFTLQGWFEKGFGRGTADDGGNNWERVLMFDAVCCASKIS